MSTGQGYTIRLVDTTAGFAELAGPWRRLEQEAAHINISASYDWLWAWWSVFARRNSNLFGRNKQLRILLLSRNDELVAIAPLVRLHRWHYLTKVTYIEFLAQQWSGTLTDFVSRERTPAVTQAVLEWLRTHERFDVLQLSYIPGDSPFFDPSDPRCTLLSACPIVYRKNYADYEAYQKALHTRNFRSNVRKSLSRIEAQQLRLEHVVRSPADAASLEEMARLSRSKLADGKHSHWLDPDKARFFAALAQALPSEAHFLRLNGQNVLYILSFYYANGLFADDTSYDRQYSEFSLGRLALVESVRRLFARPGGAFHCGGTGLGFHKRGHYPGVLPIRTFTGPGTTSAATRHAQRQLERNTAVAQTFTTELQRWRGHE